MVVWYSGTSTSPTKFLDLSPRKGGGIQPISQVSELSWVWLDIPSALMECPSNYWYWRVFGTGCIDIISTLRVSRGRFGGGPKPGVSFSFFFVFGHRAYNPVAIAACCIVSNMQVAYSVHQESQRTNEKTPPPTREISNLVNYLTDLTSQVDRDSLY